MELLELIKLGTDARASDIHITVGIAPAMRIDGKLVKLDRDILTPQDTKDLIYKSLDETY